MNQSKTTLQDVLLLRCLAVISLVAWHSYCSYICWGYGNSPLDGVYGKIFSFLTPDANMPLFTFMAGYLFCFLLKKKQKYQEFKPFLQNKVHRLLIPFLLLGALTNLTEVNRNFLQDMFYGKPSHLWYCLMLFYCYIACWLIEKRGQKYNIAAMCVSMAVVIAKGKGGLALNVPFGLFLPVYYYCYFYIGYLVFQYKENFLRLMKKYWMVVFLGYGALSILDKSHLILIHSLSYISLLLFVFNSGGANSVKLSQDKLLTRVLNSIAKCSMGIYVFHQWIIWNITRPEFLHDFIHERYIIFPLLCWILIFMLSWLMTHLLTKYTRVGRYLLL